MTEELSSSSTLPGNISISIFSFLQSSLGFVVDLVFIDPFA